MGSMSQTFSSDFPLRFHLLTSLTVSSPSFYLRFLSSYLSCMLLPLRYFVCASLLSCLYLLRAYYYFFFMSSLSSCSFFYFSRRRLAASTMSCLLRSSFCKNSYDGSLPGLFHLLILNNGKTVNMQLN